MGNSHMVPRLRNQPFGLALLLALPAFAAAQLPDKIAALIAQHPVIQRGHLGYKVVDLDSGAVLAEKDASQFFIPASNTKLYTTAFALVRLGPNYTFKTDLRTSSPWQPGQTAIASLALIGGGDPNLSGRTLPYTPPPTPDPPQNDPLLALKDLADKFAATGITEIDGDVIGEAGRYTGGSYPDGWTLDDSLYGYGASVSALTLNDGVVSISVTPGDVGDLPTIQMTPDISHFIALNQVITTASSTASIRLTREPGSNEVVLEGTIGNLAPAWKEDLGVENPALFAAEAFTSLLRDRGISVLGSAAADYSPAASARFGTLLASRVSPPLWQAAQVVNKVSQNLYAEMLLREVAAVDQGIGSQQAGVAERDAFLATLGINPEGTGLALEDGSGLARQNLTTPGSTVALLSIMWNRPERDVWLQTLPIGGVDGSLQHRFQNIPGAERVHAKTGSISHVNTLSGYIETSGHRWLVFSIMMNSTVGQGREVIQFLDQFCALFLN